MVLIKMSVFIHLALNSTNYIIFHDQWLQITRGSGMPTNYISFGLIESVGKQDSIII